VGRNDFNIEEAEVRGIVVAVIEPPDFLLSAFDYFVQGLEALREETDVMEKVLSPLLPCAVETPVEATPQAGVGLGVEGHGVLELAVYRGTLCD
jgi:hypothetical protein